ncbi:hypothetical protein VE02_03071 [Pseudogymnoascus sp. 03VT05]|nr:hypothetical protein VE02_03071 [Pseudogymnoascus sp. 03VT05]
MARPSIRGDSDLIEDQIQREAKTHGNSNPSSDKKKRKRSRQSKSSEDRRRGKSLDNMNSRDINLGHDDSMSIVAEKDSLALSPSKKRKKNKHRNQSRLYEVPGVENFPAKRKTSYRIAQDRATDATQKEINNAPAKAGNRNNVSSYPGVSPFMSPPKGLVPHASAVKTIFNSPSTQQARLDTILKSCSRKTVPNAAVDDTALDNESDDSDSPPVGLQPATVKVEHEGSKISLRDIVRACDCKDGRFSCPIEGCGKSYTRKDSLSGHMPKSHGDQILRDNGDKTYSVVTQSKVTADMDRNLESARREIRKYANLGGNNNEGMTDQLAKKVKEKEVFTATKLKPKPRNVAIELSVPAKSELPDHGGEVERDSSASPVVVRPPMNPRSPKPIKPAVGNITAAELPYVSAMEDWEVSPGTVRTARDNSNSGGHEIAYSAHYIRNNPTVTEFANTSFAIHTILGGRSFGLPLETFVRVCYVVSGKLQVHVDGVDFAIGKGGMWRVTGLGSCIVGNRSYEDAVIHITSIRIERGVVV